MCPLADKVQGLISLIDDSMTNTAPTPGNESPSKSWAISADKSKDEFRNYEENPRQEMVRELYRQQHENMTFDFVMKQRAKYLKFDKCVMTMLSLTFRCIDCRLLHLQIFQLGHAAISW